MTESVETKIFRKIKRAKNDLLFSVDMFANFGNAKAVSKALERLTKEKAVSCGNRLLCFTENA